MKTIKLILILLLPYLSGISQVNPSLPTNELGQVTFSEVVTVENTPKEVLFTNALTYLQATVDDHNKLETDPIVNEDHTEVTLPLAYTVYHDFPVHSPHGIIKYNFTVSVKDSRYRYVATGFTFHYLKRNRYGKFVEVKGKSKTLEEPVFKGQQKLWEQHKEQVQVKVDQFVQELKAHMMMLPQVPEEEIVKVNDDNW
jgi:hypothetical protein